MARLYSNENFPLPVVVRLRQLGHDAVTILDRGRAGEGVSDPEVLKLADSEGRAVLTFNRKDYIRLHRSVNGHSGIVICKFDLDFAGLALRIHEAIADASDLTGQLVRVKRPHR